MSRLFCYSFLLMTFAFTSFYSEVEDRDLAQSLGLLRQGA